MKGTRIPLILWLMMSLACTHGFTSENLRADSVPATNRQAKQRIESLETRLLEWAQTSKRTILSSLLQDAEQWFVSTVQAGEQTRLVFTDAYEDLNLSDKVRIHTVLERAYADLGREPEREQHARRLQSLERLLSLNTRLEQWRETLRSQRQKDASDPTAALDDQFLKQARSALESIQRDAEQWFATPSVEKDRLKFTEAYDVLTNTERVMLHSMLHALYTAIGNDDMASAHRVARAQLITKVSTKTAQEILALCREGRYAEAMFYIEQIDQSLPQERKLIVNPLQPITEDERRQLVRERDSGDYLEQMILRRCLAQIYIAEDNIDQAVAQFQRMLVLNPRYSVRQDDTLPATSKVISVFESARPQSKNALPILVSLGGLGFLIGAQSGGAVTGLGVSYAIVHESVQSSDPAFVEERLRIVYRDSLGRVARSDSATTGILRIQNLGANYEIFLEAEKGELLEGTVQHGQLEWIQAEYRIKEGEAVIRLRIRAPDPVGTENEDGIIFPSENAIFQATAETAGLGSPTQASFVVTFRRSSQFSVKVRQGNQVFSIPLSAQSSSRSAGHLKCRTTPQGHLSYSFSIETEAEGLTTLQCTIPRTLQGYRVILTDLTTDQVKLMHREPVYQFFMRAGEQRSFRLTLEPIVGTRVVITGLQTSATRGSNSVAIVATLNQSAQMRISIHDARGRVIHTSTRVASRGTNRFSLAVPELRTLPPGSYLVTLETQSEDGSVTRRSVPLILTR